MEFHVDLLEGIWIASNVAAIIITFGALADAWRSRAVPDRGVARRVIARGNVRREVVRLMIQGLLLAIVIPGLTDPRPVPLTQLTLALMLVPLLMLVSTLADAWDRRALSGLVGDEMTSEQGGSLSRIEAELHRNSAISQAGVVAAERAYTEANAVNAKIAAQGVRLDQERQDRIDDRDRVER